MSIATRYPTIDPGINLDFANSRRLDPRIEFTRTSIGTYVGGDGLVKIAGTGVPRFDHNPVTGESLGLLIEEQRTNSIRNNTMVGAVAGTPGTLPTNWASPGSTAGLTQEVVGTGTESGVAYIDIKLSGTPNSSGVFDITPEPVNQVPASNGQTWNHASYVKLQAGTTTNAIVSIFVFGRNSGGGFIGDQFNETIFTPATAALIAQRRSIAFAMSDATVAYVQPRIRIAYTSGAAIDITLRIGLPQLEQGAFATSVIPTSGTAVTRSADVASITGTNFSSWYRQDEGTMFSESSITRQNSIGGTLIYFATDGTSDNQIKSGYRATGATVSQIVTSTTNVADLTPTGVLSANAIFKNAFGYKKDDFAGSGNGGGVVIDTAGNVPAISQVILGSGDRAINGYIRRLTYWPQRLPNATLQAITQ